MQRLQRFSLVLLLLCLGVAGAWAQGGKLLVTPGARVAIVGDSITEQKIYSRFIEAYLTACVPQLDAHAMQFGWGGDRTVMFARRMANDALPFHPTLVTLCFGMNDGGYRAFTPETGKAFQDPLLAIVTNFKAAGATVLVGSPGAVDSNAKYFRNGGTPPAVYNETLGKLGELAKATADAQGMPYANLHDTMMDAMAKTKAALGEDADVCGTDGVHPGWNGHLIMAYAFLKAMGFDGDLGTITIDVTGKATAENGHKILAVTGRKVDIESTRYPFIVPGAAADKRSARAMLPYLPFNQDLNRLTLVVKNIKTAQAKVTWGTVSKIFVSADLEKGINLAAEFPDNNPFVAPFAQVDKAIADKQIAETGMIKSAITNIPNMKTMLAKDEEYIADLDTVTKKLWAKEEQLYAATRATVKPVQHSITVEDVTP